MHPGKVMSTSCSPPEVQAGGPRIALVGTPADLAALAPLRSAYAEAGITEALLAVAAPPARSELVELAGGADAVLLVYPRRRSARTVVDGPTIGAADGRRVPIGIVPALGGGALERFATTAAGLHRRGGYEQSVALLAQRSRRYAHLAGRIRALLLPQVSADSVLWWPAEAIVRDDLVAGLGHGLAVALYVGHGRPNGWVGYGGVRAHHLAAAPAACGLVLSLACHTLSRRRTGLSFTEALVMQGSAAAALGSTTSTQHVENARWSLRLVSALAGGCTSAGDLLAAAEPDSDVSRHYRLIGDPLAPLVDAPTARIAARALTDDVVFHPQREAS